MDLNSVQRQLGVEFQNSDLLLEALTHSSCLNEPSMGLKRHNGGLAWLGDALIHWLVSEKMYNGELSTKELHNRREKYKGEKFLSGLAFGFKLDKFLILPEGQENIGGRTNLRNLHTVFEAIVGAIYMDQGFEIARRFVIDTIFVK